MASKRFEPRSPPLAFSRTITIAQDLAISGKQAPELDGLILNLPPVEPPQFLSHAKAQSRKEYQSHPKLPVPVPGPTPPPRHVGGDACRKKAIKAKLQPCFYGFLSTGAGHL
jgi:hypothetical protein